MGADGQSTWHSLLNRNKRSLALDRKQPQAAEIIKRLVQSDEIVVEPFPPGVMERLGIGYEARWAVNPQLPRSSSITTRAQPWTNIPRR